MGFLPKGIGSMIIPPLNPIKGTEDVIKGSLNQFMAATSGDPTEMLRSGYEYGPFGKIGGDGGGSPSQPAAAAAPAENASLQREGAAMESGPFKTMLGD